MKKLPHLRKVAGRWRASRGGNHAYGPTPAVAYQRLMTYLRAMYGRQS